MATLSQAQVDAATKAKELLSEHFEAAVIVVQSETSDNTEIQQVFYHGGYATARGLLVIGHEKIGLPRDEDQHGEFD